MPSSKLKGKNPRRKAHVLRKLTAGERETRKDATDSKEKIAGRWGRLTRAERVNILFPVERTTNLQRQMLGCLHKT